MKTIKELADALDEMFDYMAGRTEIWADKADEDLEAYGERMSETS